MNDLYLFLDQTGTSIEQWIRLLYVIGCLVCAPMALLCIAWFWKMTLAMPTKQAKKMLHEPVKTPLSQIQLTQPPPPKASEEPAKEPEQPKPPLIIRTLPPQAQKLLADIDARISLDNGWCGHILDGGAYPDPIMVGTSDGSPERKAP